MQTFHKFLTQTSHFCPFKRRANLQLAAMSLTDREHVGWWMTNLSLRLRKQPDTLPAQPNSPQGAVRISASVSARFSSLLSLSSRVVSPSLLCQPDCVAILVFLSIAWYVLRSSHSSQSYQFTEATSLTIASNTMTHAITLHRVT